MKKIISLFLSMLMLISCFTVIEVLAEELPTSNPYLPRLTLGEKVNVIATDSKIFDNRVATFIPLKTGSYVFECTVPYKNIPATKDDVPGGCFCIKLCDEEVTSHFDEGWLAMVEFNDYSNASKKAIKQYEEWGGESNNVLKFAIELKAGKTYELVLDHDGILEYTTDIIVAEHRHTLKKNNLRECDYNCDEDSRCGICDYCTDWFCNYINFTTVYHHISESRAKDAVYTGKPVKPEVIIKTSGGKLDKKFYKVTYKNNVKIGEGTAVVNFRNGYTGKVALSFSIKPKSTKIEKTKGGNKQIKVTYKKVSNITGYQFQVATDDVFKKNEKKVNINKSSKKIFAVIKNLKKGKKYYIRVRTYKTVKGKKYYSSWSKTKEVKVK